MNSPHILVNGHRQGHVSVLDRGFQYGDGAFETIAVDKGNALLLQEHLQRLKRACQTLSIPYPHEQLIEEISLICSETKEQNTQSILKIIISRGEGGRGYKPAVETDSTRVLMLSAWPEYSPGIRQQGIKVRLCKTRLGINESLAGHKHLNRLEQILARGEWDDEDIFEGLMQDVEGNVIEGTMSNVFLVKNGSVITPSLDRCGVAGVVRNAILELANEININIDETKVSLDDVYAADEVFFSNSIIGLAPAASIEQKDYKKFTVSEKIINILLEKKSIAPL